MAREVVRIEGLEGVLNTLKSLPPEMVSKAGGPVKRALKKAAEMMRDEAKRNVRQIIDEQNKNGEETESTGLLLLSIRASRGRLKALKGEVYRVHIKRGEKYPAKFQDKANSVTAAKVGRLLEYGSEKRKPMPWLRPVFDGKKMEAVNMVVSELRSNLDRIVKKLARQNKVL